MYLVNLPLYTVPIEEQLKTLDESCEYLIHMYGEWTAGKFHDRGDKWIFMPSTSDAIVYDLKFIDDIFMIQESIC